MRERENDLVVVPSWAVRDRSLIVRWWRPSAPVVLYSTWGDALLSLDRGSHRVEISGVAVDLGWRETQFLELLLLRAGATVDSAAVQALLDDGELSSTTCRVLAHRLRRALGDEFGAGLVTVRGLGYSWALPVTFTDSRSRLHASA